MREEKWRERDRKRERDRQKEKDVPVYAAILNRKARYFGTVRTDGWMDGWMG